ncbi:MAG: heparin lyase I family protein [Roseovarius sp.]|nr:heparin lyase I family protein [Roseovarius sp.]
MRDNDYYDDPALGAASDDQAQGKNRSEIGTFKHMQFGRLFTYEFDVLLEDGPSNTADFLLLAQFHQTEDLDENGNPLDAAASPPLALQLRGDRLEIAARTDPNAITTVSPDKLTTPGFDTPTTSTMYLDTDPVPRDTWINIRFEMVFDHTGAGELRVYRDGVQIVDYNGPLGYNDEIGPYLQMGVYRGKTSGPIPETTAAQFRNLTASADGTPPAMDGTSGDDEIIANKIGFWENEVLNGLDGNDTLDGGFGADTMNGGAGNDFYVVNDAGDVVNERSGGVDQGGIDQVRSYVTYTLGADLENLILWDVDDVDGTGNAKDNTIQGNTGNNVLNGQAGNDSLLGDLGDDEVNGGDGNDKVFGSGGNDTVRGDAGNDEVYGEDGDDSLEGGAGNDTLEGGAGSDTMVGGTGDDDYVVTESTDVVIENANEGIDTVRVTLSYDAGAGGHVEILNTTDQTGTAAINLFGTDQANEIRGNDGANTLSGRAGDDFVQGFGGNDNIFGGIGNDTLFGGDGADTLDGGEGADSLQGEGGADSMLGGSGDDTLFGSDGNDTLEGGDHNDSLTGGSGDDSIDGGADNDILYGGLGSDTLLGGDGLDTLRGEDGIDTLLGGAGVDQLYTGTGDGGLAEGGLGDDTYYIDASDVEIVEIAGQGHDVIRTTVTISLDADDNIEEIRSNSLSSTNDFDIKGSDIGQILRGNNGNNFLDGAGGNDTMFGYGGDDTYIIRDAGDNIVETAGNGDDTIFAHINVQLGSTQEIEAIFAADLASTAGLTLVGNDFAQAIIGDGGNNFINGKGGNDTLFGGHGNDTILGGAGVDTAVFMISSTQAGIAVGASSALITLGTGVQSVSNDIENFQFTDTTLTYAQVAARSGQSFSGTPGLLSGSASDDLLIGTPNSETLVGGGGDDVLIAGAGDDLLQGGSADDFLTGQAGNDTFSGGTGSDTVNYDTNSTTFTAAAVAGGFTLNDGTQIDLIQSDVEFVNFNDRLMTYAEASALVSVTPVINGIGTNVDGTSATEIINGTENNNWITPGGGSDTIDGGGGRDMLSFVNLADTPGRSNVQYRLDIDMGAGTAVSYDGSENIQFSAIERLTATIYADRIRGTDGDDDIRGLGDFDWIIATQGNDTIDGGTGQDMLSFLEYQSSATNVIGDVFSSNGLPPTGAQASGLVIDLANPDNNTGLAAGLTLSSVERVTGSGRQDVFYGDSGQNDFRGLGDFDWFVSSTGGRERYFGGDGVDTVTYFNASAGVIASLRNGATVNGRETGFGSGGDAARDLYFEIENLVGSRHDDSLTGSNERNQLNGLEGDDMIFGYGGVDYMMGGAGNDTINGGAGSDYALFSGNSADYTLVRNGNEVTVTGTDGADLLIDVEYFRFDDAELNIWGL